MASIRHRFVWFALVVLAPAMASTGWAIATTYQRQQQALRETTRALTLVLQREFQQRDAVLKTLAQSNALARADYRGFSREAQGAVAGSPDWIMLGDGHRQYIDTSQPDPLIAAPQPQAPGAAAFDAPSTHVSDPFGPSAAHPAGVAIERAVMPQGAGGPVFNLRMAMSVSDFDQILQDQHLPRGWVGTIIDKSGTIVARVPDAGQWRGHPMSQRLRATLAQSRQGYVSSRTLEGVPSTAFYDQTRDSGWTIVIAVPNQVLDQGVPSAVAYTVLFTLGLLLLAVLAALMLGRRLIEPIERLQELAHASAQGRELAYQRSGLSEVDHVGQALEEANRQIASVNATLRREVEVAVSEAREAQQQAAKSLRIEALGRFTGGVAHDVNNLLSVILNNLYLLQKRLKLDNGSAEVAAIRRGVTAGSELTARLLAFSRSKPHRNEQVDLQTWLPAARSFICAVVPAGVQVHFEIAPGLPPIQVDTVELELALVNLAVNASDAMPDGGQLTIAAALAQAVGASGALQDFVCVDVSDTGQGIAPEVLEKVFEPFFTTKAFGKGTGLGLSHVYGFCAQLGGMARIASVAGVGTCVSMLFPVDAAVAGAAASAINPPQPGAASGGLTAPAKRAVRILYVEDNLELAQATQAVLETFSYQVELAGDAAAGLERLNSAVFDLLLSDVAMPGALDGIDLAVAVRERFAGLPIILVSGYAKQLDLATQAGFRVLQKPCSPEQLAAAINAELAPRAGRLD
jgi:signal transduction histidine kinase